METETETETGATSKDARTAVPRRAAPRSVITTGPRTGRRGTYGLCTGILGAAYCSALVVAAVASRRSLITIRL